MSEDRALQGDQAEGRKVGAGMILVGVIAAAFVVFVLQNTDKSEITWLFFEVETPMWLALIVAAVAGALLAEAGGWLLRRRRNRSD